MSTFPILPTPCAIHYEPFTRLNDSCHFDSLDDSKCSYCEIEATDGTEKAKYKRCSNCERGVIVYQGRSIDHEPYPVGSQEWIETCATGLRTIIGPTYETCTRGCAVKIAEGYTDELKVKKKEAS